MGVITICNDFNSPISPARIFKAAVLDAHSFLPKLLPHKIKSLEIQGDGGSGTIKKLILAEDGSFNFIKRRIDELDKQNFKVKLTVIESPIIGEKVVDVVQVIASTDGGSICKGTSEFYTTGYYKIGEDVIQMGNEKLSGIFKAMEASCKPRCLCLRFSLV